MPQTPLIPTSDVRKILGRSSRASKLAQFGRLLCLCNYLSVRQWSMAIMEVCMAQSFANVCTEQTAKGRHTSLSWEHLENQPLVCDSYKDLENIQAGGGGDPGILPYCWGPPPLNRKPCSPPSGKPLTPTGEGTDEQERPQTAHTLPCLLLVCLPPGSPGVFQSLTHPPEEAAFKISGGSLGNKPDHPKKGTKISCS